MARRTTLRSSKGKKLYAVRDKSGKFKDIQTYARAHGADIKRGAKAEKGAKKKATKRRAAKKATKRPAAKRARKTATKRTARKSGVKRAVKRRAVKRKKS